MGEEGFTWGFTLKPHLRKTAEARAPDPSGVKPEVLDSMVW